MAKLWLYLCASAFLWTYCSVAEGKFISKLPPYIHTCKKNDPKINECFKQFFQSVESKFTTGIPELDMPPMEPLKIPKFAVKFPGDSKNKMEFYNLVIHGLSKLKIQELSIDLGSMKLKLKATLPSINAAGTYDIDAHMMNNAVKGKGPFKAEAYDITVDVVGDGKLIDKNGAKVLHVEHVDGDTAWKKHHVQIDNLLPEKSANDAFNNLMNGPAGQQMARSQMPFMKSIMINTVSEYLNQVTESFAFDSLFQ